MKQRFRISVVSAVVLALAACTGATISTPPAQPPGPQPPYVRGAVVSVRYVTTFDKKQMNGDLGLEGQVITSIGGAPKCTVRLYAVVYQTIGVKGEPATASEGLFVPGSGCKGPFTMIGYGQGTNVVRAQKITDPTAKNIEPVSLASIFAAHGYVVAATDYLGLGYSNYSFQPYLVGTSEASAIIDAMRAARLVAPKLKIALASNVFITGYSQGGHSILSTQKVIEAENPNEFHLIADSPGSGLYALTQTTLDLLKSPNVEKGGPVLWAYFMTAYQKTYGNAYAQPSDAFREPYASSVENLLPVDTYAQAAALNGTTLPTTAVRLLQPSFVAQFRHDSSMGVRTDLAENDLVSGWKPKAPVYLCGGSRDPVVEYKNSQIAYRFFKSEGVKVDLVDVNPLMPPSVPRSQYHDAAFVLCHTIERVKILESGGAHVRMPHTTLTGPIGPFEPQL
jgi:hypothetical protein